VPVVVEHHAVAVSHPRGLPAAEVRRVPDAPT
jgi:hypothetical protein